MNKAHCNIFIKVAKIFVLLFLINNVSSAHEPLYGLGPDVLFKRGFEPHLTFHFNKYDFETEAAMAYGVTRKWTLAPGISMISGAGKSKPGSYMIESNYRFLKLDKPGLSYKASFVTELEIPIDNSGEKNLLFAFTAGQEALRWYWFTHVGYEKNLSSNFWEKDNRFTYGLTLGVRPHKPDYYKPDLVLFIESTGSWQQEFTEKETGISQSNGNTIDIAPTFVFSYRNFAIRGGVQFGILNSGIAEKTSINGKIGLEIHL